MTQSTNSGTLIGLCGALAASLGLLMGACADADDTSTGGGANGANVPTGGGTAGAGAVDAGAGGGTAAAGGGTTTTTTGAGGSGGPDPALEALLGALRSDLTAALQEQSEADGWPAPVRDGLLFVCTGTGFDRLAGDHDAWAGTPMVSDQGFAWLVVDVPAGNRYKCHDGASGWDADPWSRAYEHDPYGIMSMVAPAAGAHLERHFAVARGNLAPRTVRVWLPAEPATHVLYVHDGQNLFDPDAPWGGWQLQASAPAGMMLVGIDNTADRMDEYTHVTDLIGGDVMGGQADAYADMVELTIRPLIDAHYGEPAAVGTMGSSLGGLVSFHIADRFPQSYAFAASLSGTMGWGSIGLTGGSENQTMIERYEAAGHRATALYLDSGGSGTCVDSDGDGIEDDDPDAGDNYCENKQLEAVLYAAGYVADTDVWHWWEANAEHNEAAWAARVWRPLDLFAAL
jgi:hypothetical protein